MTCPRCQSATVPVAWQSSTVATDKSPLRTEERFERCPACDLADELRDRGE